MYLRRFQVLGEYRREECHGGRTGVINLTLEAEHARHSSVHSALQLRHGLVTGSVNQHQSQALSGFLILDLVGAHLGIWLLASLSIWGVIPRSSREGKGKREWGWRRTYLKQC